MTEWVGLNLELVPADQARVSVFDRGFMYGDGVFETIRVYNGRPFQLGLHLDRLESSAHALHFKLGYDHAALAKGIGDVIDKNGGGDRIIRVAVSRGRGARGLSIEGVKDPTCVIATYPIPEILGERRRRGIRLSIVPTLRVDPGALPSGAKHANYLNSILAHHEAVAGGADEALLLAGDGRLTECAGANLFLVTGGVVRTPDPGSGILPGCARSLVLELCRVRGIQTEQGRLDEADLEAADEVFATNSVWEVVGVRSVGDREYGDPGPVTRVLQQAYTDETLDSAP